MTRVTAFQAALIFSANLPLVGNDAFWKATALAVALQNHLVVKNANVGTSLFSQAAIMRAWRISIRR